MTEQLMQAAAVGDMLRYQMDALRLNTAINGVGGSGGISGTVTGRNVPANRLNPPQSPRPAVFQRSQDDPRSLSDRSRDREQYPRMEGLTSAQRIDLNRDQLLRTPEREAAFRHFHGHCITRSFIDRDEYLRANFGEHDDRYRRAFWVNCLTPDNDYEDTAFGERGDWQNVYSSTRTDRYIDSFLRDSGYDYDGLRRHHYGPEWQHNVSMGVPLSERYKNTRSLLQIIRSIKKNYTKLIKNPNAYSWKWLSAKAEDCVTQAYGKMGGMRLGARDRMQIRQNPEGHTIAWKQLQRICSILQTVTGEEFILLKNGGRQYSFWPKSLCMYYWSNNYNTNQEQQVWIRADEFQKLKETNVIRLDQMSGEYVYHNLLGSYHKKVGTDKETGKPIFKIVEFGILKKNLDKIANCPNCGNYHEKVDLIFKPELEQLWCYKCAPKTVKNERAKEGYSYGNYHSHKDWKFLIRRVDEKDTGIAMGLEVEMQCKAGSQETNSWKILSDQWDLNKNWNEIYFERDGSLLNGGIEMISNPMSLAFAKDYWSKMLPVVRKYCAGWNIEKYSHGDGAGEYGIHITFDRRYFGDYRLARFIKFCDASANAWFMQGIAQRSRIYGAGHGYDGNLASGKFRKLSERVKVVNKKIYVSQARYCPVNVKGDSKLVEVRFFRSTLNTESFLKNLEFIDAMNLWTINTGYSEKAQDFCDWLVGTNWCQKRYPNLIGYLSRPKLPVKDIGSVKNPMYELFHNRSIDKLHIYNPSNPTEDQIRAEDFEPCV